MPMARIAALKEATESFFIRGSKESVSELSLIISVGEESLYPTPYCFKGSVGLSLL